MLDLEKLNKIHFIGIGGIGVSAIARMMLLKGKVVSGSDVEQSAITDELKKLGAKIYIGHSEKNITDNTDLVVYTIAVDQNNPEFVKAKELGIETRTYSQMLGVISDGYYTVAVSGTHGKTTTTAMLAKVVVDAGLDPTVIVGSLLKDSGSNLIAGNSDLFIVEACEYKRSFLDLNPNILVITNIDEDHLDYYKDLSDIQSAFASLVEKLGSDDFVVCNPNDPKVIPVLKNAKCKIVNYTNLRSLASQIELRVAGEYNVENAEAALAAARALKISEQDATKSLSEFEGVWRRFEYKGKTENGAEVYDDYAHHPTEIRAALCAAREKFPTRKITVVFQPHLYSRTKLLLNDMAVSFKSIDKVLIAPIYAAREKKDQSISSSILVDEINKNTSNAQAYENFSDIEAYLRENTGKDDIIITMGAGDVFKIAESILKTNF